MEDKFANVEDDWRIYNLRDPEYWGEKFWDFLYLMALGLPVTLNKQYSLHVSTLIKNFYLYLPCIHCRYHYFNMVKDKKYEFTNKNEVLNTIVQLHNSVRKRLSKGGIPHFSVVTHFHDEQKYGKTYLITSILVLTVVIGLYFFRK